MPKSIIFTKQEAHELERGQSFRVINKPRTVEVVAWKDSKPLYFINTAPIIGKQTKAARRTGNQTILINRPAVVAAYNEGKLLYTTNYASC